MATRILFPNAGARNESATCYGLIFNDQGQVRQFTDNTWAAYVTANLDNYDTGAAALPASGHFALTFPDTIAAGRYWVELWKRAGGTVDESADTYVNGVFIYWDGEALIEVDSVRAASALKKNTAFPDFTFVMIGTDGNPAIGKTVTAQRRLDDGAFASCANAPTEVANGAYAIDLDAADLNGNCVTFRFTATGCRPTILTLFPPP